MYLFLNTILYLAKLETCPTYLICTLSIALITIACPSNAGSLGNNAGPTATLFVYLTICLIGNVLVTLVGSNKSLWLS